MHRSASCQKWLWCAKIRSIDNLQGNVDQRQILRQGKAHLWRLFIWGRLQKWFIWWLRQATNRKYSLYGQIQGQQSIRLRQLSFQSLATPRILAKQHSHPKILNWSNLLLNNNNFIYLKGFKIILTVGCFLACSGWSACCWGTSGTSGRRF